MIGLKYGLKSVLLNLNTRYRGQDPGVDISQFCSYWPVPSVSVSLPRHDSVSVGAGVGVASHSQSLSQCRGLGRNTRQVELYGYMGCFSSK